MVERFAATVLGVRKSYVETLEGLMVVATCAAVSVAVVGTSGS